MGTPARDEGLDNLEAFIALLDRTRDRFEEGAERLEALAGELAEGAAEIGEETRRLEQMLAEHLGAAGVEEEDAAEGAEAVSSGGQGAMALAMTVTTALAELTAESTSGAQATGATSGSLAEAAAAVIQLGGAALEFVVAETGTLLSGEMDASNQLVLGLLTQLQEVEAAHQEEMTARLLRKSEEAQATFNEMTESRMVLGTVMIAITVMLVVIAIVAAVFSMGAATGVTVTAIAGAVVLVAAATATLIQTILMNIEPLGRGLAVILKNLGLGAEGETLEEMVDALDHLLDQDWVKMLLVVASLLAAIVTLVATMSGAASLAPLLVALAVPLTVALRVVENVSRLLSALNPFD